MPTNNETIVAIPIGLENVEELRKFLVNLVVKLDIVLGYREGSTPNELATRVLFASEFEEFKEALDIGTLNSFSQTITDPPTQAEVQVLSTQVTDITNKLNELIGVL